MSSLDQQTTQGQAEQSQSTGTEQAQAGMQPGQSPSTGPQVPGLPPTALQMQMQSMLQQRQQSSPMGATLGGGLMLDQRAPQSGQFARTSLQDMAEQLARSYGLNFGLGSLVDPEGNFLQTPDQLAAGQPGSDMGMIAADMNRVAQAINDRQIEMQQNKATAALQAGMGQIQQRGRGSLAALQSNFYQQMAANYTDPNLLPEQADFSYWIQKAGFDEAAQTREKELAETGGSGAAPSGTGSTGSSTRPDAYKENVSVSQRGGSSGRGDVVTSGPHAGERPVYTYDPISKTTTVSWEKA